MLNPKQIHMLDQSIATFKEVYPRMWRAIYIGCVDEGFTEYQALELTRTFVAASVAEQVKAAGDGDDRKTGS